MTERIAEPIERTRRDFLKKSAVAGAVVWTAPVVTSLPGGRAFAQTPGSQCPTPAGTCTSDAFGLRVTAPIIGTLTFGQAPTCLLNPVINQSILHVTAATICGETTSSPCVGHGFIEQLSLSIDNPTNPLLPDILTVTADVLDAQAQNNGACVTDCAATGSSVVANVVINGINVNVNAPCNTVPIGFAPLLVVTVNEQFCDSNGVLNVNALHISSAALGIDVILGHAAATRGGCACTTC